MQEYDIFLFDKKESFVNSYVSNLVPNKDDVITIDGVTFYQVLNRIIHPKNLKIVLIIENASYEKIIN